MKVELKDFKYKYTFRAIDKVVEIKQFNFEGTVSELEAIFAKLLDS